MRLTLDDADFERAARELNCEVPAVRAVGEVEAFSAPFLSTREPVILFERHYFYRLTNGNYTDLRVEGLPYPSSVISAKSPGGYGRIYDQHKRLAAAVRCNRNAALMSASWGMFQIMGLYHAEAGHATIQSFVNAMYDGADKHLDAFVAVVQHRGLDRALRSKSWAKFAQGWNGAGYKKNKYDVKMAAAYDKWKLHGLSI